MAGLIAVCTSAKARQASGLNVEVRCIACLMPADPAAGKQALLASGAALAISRPRNGS